MTDTADRTPVMVFADELEEGDVLAVKCGWRSNAIRDENDRPTGYATCAYLGRSHTEDAGHALTVERLRKGPGVTYVIARNEDDEQVSWSAPRNQPVRTFA